MSVAALRWLVSSTHFEKRLLFQASLLVTLGGSLAPTNLGTQCSILWPVQYIVIVLPMGRLSPMILLRKRPINLQRIS